MLNHHLYLECFYYGADGIYALTITPSFAKSRYSLRSLALENGDIYGGNQVSTIFFTSQRAVGSGGDGTQYEYTWQVYECSGRVVVRIPRHGRTSIT